MFYQDYQEMQHLKEKLLARFTKRQAIMNQEVHIRDLFVYPTSSERRASFGEKEYCSAHSGIPTMERLEDHIASLAKIANSYHQKYYCDKKNGDYTLRPDCLNKVTRLSLSEFSLYTPEPLGIKALGNFVEKLHKIARQQQPNVHLLLSSKNNKKISRDGVYW